MAILAHVTYRGGGAYEEVFRWRRSPATWNVEDVTSFARQLRSLIGGGGDWRWSVEGSSDQPQMVVESPTGTARSGPLRLSKDVLDVVRHLGGEGVDVRYDHH